MLSRIANFDDLDPWKQEPGVRLSMVPPGTALPGDADVVIIPGTKSTLGDLAFFRAQGWDVDLVAHVRRGGQVLGLCGGYQMLGRTIADPAGLDGQPGEQAGLGLLDIETVMHPDKRLSRVSATHANGVTFEGYEIHIGRTTGPDTARPFARITDQPDGATSPDGKIAGTYLHGLFSDDVFRRAWLAERGVDAGQFSYGAGVEAALDALAAHLETHMDLDALFDAAEPISNTSARASHSS